MNRFAPPYDGSRPRVVSFGGGKGGVGRSTLCAEVARALGRQNQRVLCVDASWTCPTLHIFLHADEPPDSRRLRVPPIGDDGAHIADFIQEVPNKNIWYASLSTSRRAPFMRSRFRAETMIHQLLELDFDWVFLDLAPELDPPSLEFFALSDIPIVVCTPEPAAVRMATQFLRGVFFQAVGYHPDAYELRDDLMGLLEHQSLALNARRLRRDGHANPDLLDLIEETAAGLETYLVVNLVREGAERDLGYVISHAFHEELGIFPRVLTSVDFEDRRWFYNRRIGDGSQPTRADEALSSDIERLARSIVDIDAFDARFPRPVNDIPEAHPAYRLGINPEAGPNQLRQHCRRLWEGYRRETVVSLVFSQRERRQQMAEKLERLYRKVLTTPTEQFLTMRTGDYSTEPPPGLGDATTQDALSAMMPAAHDTTPQAPPPPHLDDASAGVRDEAGHARPQLGPLDELVAFADARSAGGLIQKLRRSHGISLQELSLRTSIGINHLAAIEDGNAEALPRDVYLRGYLREIAKVFDVDADQLIGQYFRFLQ